MMYSNIDRVGYTCNMPRSKTTAAPKPARKPRLSRGQQREQRTTELLEAAWAMFCEKGYEAVTIENVAAYAGYSRMPIYSLFGDKQNLYFELWRKAVSAISETLLGNLRPGMSLRKNLLQLAEVVAQGPAAGAPDKSPESLFFAVQTIALSRPDIAVKLEKLSREVVANVARIVRESALEPGDVLRADPEIIAAHIVAQINGLSTVQFQTRKRFVRARDLAAIFNGIALRAPHE